MTFMIDENSNYIRSQTHTHKKMSRNITFHSVKSWVCVIREYEQPNKQKIKNAAVNNKKSYVRY